MYIEISLTYILAQKDLSVLSCFVPLNLNYHCAIEISLGYMLSP